MYLSEFGILLYFDDDDEIRTRYNNIQGVLENARTRMHRLE